MVNVPSSDRFQVISAWIALKEIKQAKISVKNFFIIRQKKGRRLPKSSSWFKVSPNTAQVEKDTTSPCPKRTRSLLLFLFSLVETGDFWIREQKLIALCIFYVERIDSCSPKLINKCLTIRWECLRLSSAWGKRYRSSDFILKCTFCFLYCF